MTLAVWHPAIPVKNAKKNAVFSGVSDVDTRRDGPAVALFL